VLLGNHFLRQYALKMTARTKSDPSNMPMAGMMNIILIGQSAPMPPSIAERRPVEWYPFPGFHEIGRKKSALYADTLRRMT
jgi:hypothetical protein